MNQETALKIIHGPFPFHYLSEFDRFFFKQLVIRILINRLCVQDELKRQPDILNKKIVKPLFIISLQRTGTTILHILLAQDTNVRYLRHWEAEAPSLHPDLQIKGKGPHLKMPKDGFVLVNISCPCCSWPIIMTSEEPEECQYFSGHRFANEGTFYTAIIVFTNIYQLCN